MRARLLLGGWVWLGLACGGGPGGEVVVREGVASLEAHIHVPDILHDTTWAARPLGQSSLAPGPTDLELLAWFPVPEADRAAVEAALGPTQGERTVSVPSALAVALPEALRASQGDLVTLTGEALPAAAFERIGWRASFAVLLPGGIAVYLHSQ